MITGAACGLTVNVNVEEPVPRALVAFRSMVKVPVLVGYPERAPVAELRVSPEGSPPPVDEVAE